LVYDIKVAYLNEIYKTCDYLTGIDIINDHIHSEDIEVVLFNIDFFNYIDNLFINRINSKFKVLFSHDDATLHYRNVVTAVSTRVNSIIVADPVSVLKYRSVGVNSFFLPLEGGAIYKFSEDIEVKDIDILFIGSLLKADRRSFIDAIEKRGFSVLVAGGEVSSLSYAELISLMTRAKIVLNLSKSSELHRNNPEGYLVYKYEFKGRVLEAGLSGSLCLSEYSPSMELLFQDNTMPMFKNLDECILQLDVLLNDKKLYQRSLETFISKCKELRPSCLIKSYEITAPAQGLNFKCPPLSYLIESVVSRPIFNAEFKVVCMNIAALVYDLISMRLGVLTMTYIFCVLISRLISFFFEKARVTIYYSFRYLWLKLRNQF
jgi:hypothetical protein